MNKRELLVHLQGDHALRWWLIEHGTPSASGQSAGLLEIPDQLEVTELRVLIPSAWVTYRTVDLPKLGLKEAYKALAFLLEDQLLEDPAALHFSLLKRDKTSYHLWIVAQSRLSQLQDLASQKGLRLMAVYPDYFALDEAPVLTQGQVSPWVFGETNRLWCVRQSRYAGFGVGHARAGVVVSRLFETEILPPQCRVPARLKAEVLGWPALAARLETGKTELVEWPDQRFPLGILTQTPPINLIRPVRSRIPLALSACNPLRIGAGLFGLSLLSFILVTSMAWHTHQVTEQWRAAITENLASLLPPSTAVVLPDSLYHLRSHVATRNQLGPLGASSADWVNFLSIARVIKSIDGLSLLHLAWQDKVWKLSLQCYQLADVERLTEAFKSSGFTVIKRVVHTEQKALLIQLSLRGSGHE
jgi:type II secretion system protein L